MLREDGCLDSSVRAERGPLLPSRLTKDQNLFAPAGEHGGLAV